MLASLLAAFASGETHHLARQVRLAAIAYLLAGMSMLVALGFAVGAGYVAAANRYGTIEAALAFAGGFFLLAVLILLVHRIASRLRARSIARKRSTELTTIVAAAALAALPTLARGKGGLASLLAPAVAIAAYAIYRENRKATPGDKDAIS
jgi:hypothetical protein